MGRTISYICAATLLSLSIAWADAPADLIRAGRTDEAIAQIEKSGPKDAASFNLLCRAYYQVRNWDRGIVACEKAVSLEPNNGLYHLWLGRIYGEKADSVSFFSAASWAGKTRTEFENAVRLAPDNVEARSNLAEYYFEAPGIMGGGKDKAEAQAQALDKISPAAAHWVRAKLAEKRKDVSAAEREYRAAIQASKDPAVQWLDLASFFRKQNRPADMEDAISHAVATPKDHPEVLVDAADMLMKAGRNLQFAGDLLKRYLDSSSKSEDAPAFKAYYLLGTLLEKQGDKKGAADQYTHALALAKNYSAARDALNRVSR